MYVLFARVRITAINSCVVKLSRLTPPMTVYRGFSNASLPHRWWKADEGGIRGGIEFGFLSTTTDRAQALHYASGHAPTVLELETGMVDRGASLRWLSWYPHEQEILFPPLTGLEPTGSHVDSRTLVVHTRVSINLMALTLEQVVSKRARTLTEIAHNIVVEARAEFTRKVARRVRGNSVTTAAPADAIAAAAAPADAPAIGEAATAANGGEGRSSRRSRSRSSNRSRSSSSAVGAGAAVATTSATEFGLFARGLLEEPIRHEPLHFNEDAHFSAAVDQLLSMRRALLSSDDTALRLTGCSGVLMPPPSLGRLCSLTVLHFEDCTQLRSLPHEIGELVQLLELRAVRCPALVAMPDATCKLRKLELMELCECTRLGALPCEIGALGALRHLGLSGCTRLVALPPSCARLEALQSLHLKGCHSLLRLPNLSGLRRLLRTGDLTLPRHLTPWRDKYAFEAFTVPLISDLADGYGTPGSAVLPFCCVLFEATNAARQAQLQAALLPLAQTHAERILMFVASQRGDSTTARIRQRGAVGEPIAIPQLVLIDEPNGHVYTQALTPSTYHDAAASSAAAATLARPSRSRAETAPWKQRANEVAHIAAFIDGFLQGALEPVRVFDISLAEALEAQHLRDYGRPATSLFVLLEGCTAQSQASIRGALAPIASQRHASTRPILVFVATKHGSRAREAEDPDFLLRLREEAMLPAPSSSGDLVLRDRSHNALYVWADDGKCEPARRAAADGGGGGSAVATASSAGGSGDKAGGGGSGGSGALLLSTPHAAHRESGASRRNAATGPKTAGAAIQSAINVGAPAFNRGETDACHYVYRRTAEEILRRCDDATVRHALNKAIEDAGKLKEGMHQQTDSQQAWHFRYGFDCILKFGSHMGDPPLRDVSMPTATQLLDEMYGSKASATAVIDGCVIERFLAAFDRSELDHMRVSPLKAVANAAHSDDYQLKYDAACDLRRMLDSDRHANEQTVSTCIRLELVSRMVDFLTLPNASPLVLQTLCALTSFAALGREAARSLMEQSAIEQLQALISGVDVEIQMQAIRALGTIAAASVVGRDEVIRLRSLPCLLEQVSSAAPLTLQRIGMWAVVVLCAGVPAPALDAVREALPVLGGLLQSEDESVAADACWALSYVAGGGGALARDDDSDSDDDDNDDDDDDDDDGSDGGDGHGGREGDSDDDCRNEGDDDAATEDVEGRSNGGGGGGSDDGSTDGRESLGRHRIGTGGDASDRDDLARDRCAERLEAVFAAVDCSHVCALLTHSSATLQSGALRLVGHAATGGSAVVQVLLGNGLLGALKELLATSQRSSVHREVCTVVSKIAAGAREQADVLLESGLIALLAPLIGPCRKQQLDEAPAANLDVARESTCSIGQVAETATAERIVVCMRAARHDHIACRLVVALESDDMRLVRAAMRTTHRILEAGAAASDGGEVAPQTDMPSEGAPPTDMSIRYHPGAMCVVTGVMPIEGVRYSKRGHLGYDLCQEAFGQLSAEQQQQHYEAIEPTVEVQFAHSANLCVVPFEKAQLKPALEKLVSNMEGEKEEEWLVATALALLDKYFYLKALADRPTKARRTVASRLTRLRSGLSMLPAAPPADQTWAVGDAHALSSVKQAIAAAVRLGTLLFNQGDLAGCAWLYARTAEECAIRCADDDPIAVMLARGLSVAELKAQPGEKAWALRRVFDEIMSGARNPLLEQLPTAHKLLASRERNRVSSDL